MTSGIPDKVDSVILVTPSKERIASFERLEITKVVIFSDRYIEVSEEVSGKVKSTISVFLVSIVLRRIQFLRFRPPLIWEHPFSENSSINGAFMEKVFGLK